MVEEQITGPGRLITEEKVVAAIGDVPRHQFVGVSYDSWVTQEG
jgi:protein-L-isoaspartate O-methyltransferase